MYFFKCIFFFPSFFILLLLTMTGNGIMVSDNRRKLKCVEKLSGEATATGLGPGWL